MPITKMPGTKGGYRATYGGVTRNFKTRAAAEKWAAKYKVQKHTKTLKKISNLWNKTPKSPKVGTPRRRTGKTSRAY